MKTQEKNPVMEKELSFAQRQFISGIITHGNRRIAYQGAFPAASANTARINACKLMKNEQVLQAVERGRQQAAPITDIDMSVKETRRAARVAKMRNVLDGILNGTIVTQQVVTTSTGKVRHVKNTTDVKALIAAIKSYDKLEHLLDAPRKTD